jgi:nucleotide-binding universal stress UspA family protein
MATDGSAEATAAIRAASRLLRTEDNQIDVLCVTPELYSPGSRQPKSEHKSGGIRDTYRGRVKKEVSRILEQALGTLQSEGIKAKARVETGSPAALIIKLSKEYDLTVLGPKGHNEPTKLGLGPVASRVVEHAEGVVLIGRELIADKGLRILVGIDGSRVSKIALRAMTSYLNLMSSEVTLMHVVETPWIHLGLDQEWFTYPEDIAVGDETALRLEGEFQHEAEAVIENARRAVSKPGVSIDTIVVEGNAGTEILGEAEGGDYDLVVIGATGLTDYKHNLLGSVSAKLAWTAPCSVMVVRDRHIAE